MVTVHTLYLVVSRLESWQNLLFVHDGLWSGFGCGGLSYCSNRPPSPSKILRTACIGGMLRILAVSTMVRKSQ